MKTLMIAFLALFTVTSFAEEISRIETVTASMESDAPVRVVNINGDITVSGWDSEQVELTYTVTADSQEDMDAVDVLVDTENGIECEVQIEPDQNESVNCSVDFVLNVPAGTELNYQLENINGEIKLSDASGSAGISLVNGDVEVGGFSGDMFIEVINGDVAAIGVPEMDTVEIVNGSVKLSVAELLNDVNIETVNGSVEVSLETDALVEIETMTGVIHIADNYDFAISEDVVGSSAEFGEGDYTLAISTLNGDIEITE